MDQLEALAPAFQWVASAGERHSLVPNDDDSCLCQAVGTQESETLHLDQEPLSATFWREVARVDFADDV